MNKKKYLIIFIVCAVFAISLLIAFLVPSFLKKENVVPQKQVNINDYVNPYGDDFVLTDKDLSKLSYTEEYDVLYWLREHLDDYEDEYIVVRGKIGFLNSRYDDRLYYILTVQSEEPYYTSKGEEVYRSLDVHFYFEGQFETYEHDILSFYRDHYEEELVVGGYLKQIIWDEGSAMCLSGSHIIGGVKNG